MFVLLCALNTNAQVVKASPVHGFDEPVYGVMYEVVPHYICSDNINTIIFEVPVTEDYYHSVTEGQVVTSWFRTLDNQVYTASVPHHWKLKIIRKRIWSK